MATNGDAKAADVDAMATDDEKPSGAAEIKADTKSLELAVDKQATDPDAALEIFRQIVADESAGAEALRVKEQAIQGTGDILASQGKAEELRFLLKSLRPFFGLIPKAKTAKIVRTIIDQVAKVPNSTQVQVELCKEQVEWTKQEKRSFLRQRVESRLAALYMEIGEFQAALQLIGSLLREVKRLDDKLLLVEIHLLESKLHHGLRNLPKAKAALTAARTAANAIYVPPAQQGLIDMQSGTLHAEEKDYKTGYSYFYEAFEAFSALDDPKAVLCLKYMLLCKVMTNQAEDVNNIISSKGGLKYTGPEVDALKAVATAHSKRSLKDFEQALQDHQDQLKGDAIIEHHLAALYDTLLQQNLIRIIEPYSRVELEHVAKLINLPQPKVEAKLSQMILDHRFAGTLDQGSGVLIIFDDLPPDTIYPTALETIENMSKVVDSLYRKSAKIAA